MDKKLVFFFLFVGSTIGSFIPFLWGDTLLSLSSILLSGVGGLMGIYFGYKLTQRM